jgi:hypothetical protein
MFRNRLLAGTLAVAIGLGAATPALAQSAAAPVGIPDCQPSALDHAAGFAKGVGSGAWDGTTGTVSSVVHLGTEAYGLATDSDSRRGAWNSTVEGAAAVKDFAATAATDPRKAAGEIGDAASEAWHDRKAAYLQAAVECRGTEFIGHALGEAGVAVGSMALPAVDYGRVAALLRFAKAGEAVADVATEVAAWEAPANPSWWQKIGVKAELGESATKDYAITFFKAHPESNAWEVHHAVPQELLTNYPGLVTEREMHSLENLRGIADLRDHYAITKEWNRFFAEHPPGTLTRKQLLAKATDIDTRYGPRFDPPVLSLSAKVAEKAKNLGEKAKNLAERAKDLVPSWEMPTLAMAR